MHRLLYGFNICPNLLPCSYKDIRKLVPQQDADVLCYVAQPTRQTFRLGDVAAWKGKRKEALLRRERLCSSVITLILDLVKKRSGRKGGCRVPRQRQWDGGFCNMKNGRNTSSVSIRTY